MKTDVREHNRRAWDAEVERGGGWTVPSGPELTQAALVEDRHAGPHRARRVQTYTAARAFKH